MTMGTMTNLTGTTIMTTDKKSSYIVADRSLARQAYPWCVTSTTTSYFLQPSVNKTLSTKDYIEYSFEMDENYDFCKQILAKKQKSAAAIARMCNTPFYSFMIAVSDECHEAIMSVLTVQMYAVENVVSVAITRHGGRRDEGVRVGSSRPFVLASC